uniref:Uncharacterized protein n=1 Tax=Panagrolaimus sp. ES5 TaxID=591445 RepID=A0AC34GND6_9BILA
MMCLSFVMDLSADEKNQICEKIAYECKKAEITAGNLLHAPLACSLIQSLAVLASCTKDFSIKSGDSNEAYKYLNHRESFKSSLYTVINSMNEAFQVAHNSMETIDLSLSEIPQLMVDTLNALNEPNGVFSQQTINFSLSVLNQSAEKCVVAAKIANEGCEKALCAIKELSEASLATRGKTENRLEAAKKEHEEHELFKDHENKEIEEINEKIEEQKQHVDDAREMNRYQMKESTLLLSVMGAMAFDKLTSLTQSFGDIVTIVKQLPETALIAVDTDFPNFRTKLTVAQQEYLDLAMRRRYSENVEEHLNNLKYANTYGTGSQMENLLLKTKYIMISCLEAIHRKEPNCQRFYDDAKTKAAINLKLYQKARELSVQNNPAMTNEERTALSLQESKERQTLTRTLQENLKTSREIYAAERKIQCEYRKEKTAIRQKLCETITKLNNLKIEEKDLGTILECLQEGIEQLAEVQIAWERIVDFFSHIQNTVNGPLDIHIQQMTKYTEMITDNYARIESELQRKIWFREVAKICAVANVLRQCAKLYGAISTQYIKPTNIKSVKYLMSTKAQALAKQDEILSDFHKIEDAVQKTIKDHSLQLSVNVYAELKSHGFDINKAIEDINGKV